MDELINIQLNETGKEWSEVTEFKTLKVNKDATGAVCQAIADFTGRAIRLTRPFGNVSVDRLNGGYFYPNK